MIAVKTEVFVAVFAKARCLLSNIGHQNGRSSNRFVYFGVFGIDLVEKRAWIKAARNTRSLVHGVAISLALSDRFNAFGQHHRGGIHHGLG